MSLRVSRTVTKLVTCSLLPSNDVIFYFVGQSPTFDKLFPFYRIYLKFEGGVNFETLISYFRSILGNLMDLIKKMTFIVIFKEFSSNNVQQKCCHGSRVSISF